MLEWVVPVSGMYTYEQFFAFRICHGHAHLRVGAIRILGPQPISVEETSPGTAQNLRESDILLLFASQAASGAIACQLIDATHPGTIQMHRVRTCSCVQGKGQVLH